MQYFADGGEGDDGKPEEGGETQKKDVAGQQQQKSNSTIDEGEIKRKGVAEFLKSLGVDTEEDLQGIVKVHKEEQDKNLTELEKANRERDLAVKRYVEEHEAKVLLEAQLEAIKLGAVPELVEGLVLIAKSKVTKDKGVKEVLNEIKQSEVGKVYFSEGEGDTDDKNKTIVTRRDSARESGRLDKNSEGKTGNKNSSKDGGIASRLLANRTRSERKSSYWS